MSTSLQSPLSSYFLRSCRSLLAGGLLATQLQCGSGDSNTGSAPSSSASGETFAIAQENALPWFLRLDTRPGLDERRDRRLYRQRELCRWI